VGDYQQVLSIFIEKVKAGFTFGLKAIDKRQSVLV